MAPNLVVVNPIVQTEPDAAATAQNGAGPVGAAAPAVAAREHGLAASSPGAAVAAHSAPIAVLPATVVPAGDLTDELPLVYFAEPFAAFLAREGSRSDGTIQSILKNLRTIQQIWFDFSTVPVKDLRKRNITELVGSLNHAIVEVTEQNYANDSKNACTSAVRQLLEYLCDELELISDEKFERLAKKLKFYQSNARVVDLPTNDQIDIMRQYLRQSFDSRGRYWAQIPYMFDVYRMFAPRKGSVRGLKVWDVDFINSRIRIRINKQKKGASARVVSLLMPDSLRQRLLEYVTRFQLKPHEPLFTVSDIRGSLKSAAAAAGLPNWYHHAFRKLVTIRMIEANVPVPVIAAILGHRDNGETILRNYWHYCEAAMDAALMKYDAWCNGIQGGSAAELIRLKAALLEILERICSAPEPTLAAIATFLFRIDEHLRAGRYAQVVAEVPGPPQAALPDAATAAVPHLHYKTPEHESRTVADNFMYLLLANGRSVHEVERAVGLTGNSLYLFRKGRGITPSKRGSVEKYFHVATGYLADPTRPKADFPLIRKNLQYIAGTVGLNYLPRLESISEVLDGVDLPCGKTLRRLAEALPFLSIHQLMTVDIAQTPDLVQALHDAGRGQRERKANIAAHIQEHYRKANANGMKLAAATGLKEHRIHAYASGRQLPQEQDALKIARALGLALLDLYRPTVQPDAAAVGARLATWIAALNLTPRKAAYQMKTSVRDFLKVIRGERLPSGRQLQKFSAFLGKSSAEILGTSAAATAAASPTGQPGQGMNAPNVGCPAISSQQAQSNNGGQAA